MNLNDLAVECFERSEEKGFWPNYHTIVDPLSAHEVRQSNAEISTRLALIHSEVSEALEELRSGNGGHDLTQLHFEVKDIGSPEKPVGFASELADIVIRVLDLCGGLGIDIEDAIKTKMRYNQTREPKHGKEF